jgi:hypothetical protein
MPYVLAQAVEQNAPEFVSAECRDTGKTLGRGFSKTRFPPRWTTCSSPPPFPTFEGRGASEYTDGFTT